MTDDPAVTAATSPEALAERWLQLIADFICALAVRGLPADATLDDLLDYEREATR